MSATPAEIPGAAGPGGRRPAGAPAPEGLAPGTWDALAPWLTEVRLAPGERLFREGEAADSLYVVRQGTLDIHFERDPDHLLDRVGPGQVVGEMALLLGGRRSASATAAGEVVALRLGRDRYEVLAASHPDLGRDLSAALHERVRRTQLATHLRAILGDLGPEALREIQSKVEWVQIRSGEALFHQGDPPDGAYILALGRLRVAVRDPETGAERVVDETAPGQWIGEMGLLAQQPRSATVYALRDSELVWLSASVFEEIVARWPQAMLHTARLLVERLDRQIRGGTSPAGRPRSLAVVAARPDLDLGWLVSELFRGLAAYGPARVVDARIVGDALGKPGVAQVDPSDPAHLQVSAWLSSQEALHDTVIYRADPRWSAWTERAVRQADVVLVVADGSGSPEPGEVERRLAGLADSARLPEQVLVLLQPPGQSRFPGTGRFLDARRPSRHLHVRWRDDGDVRRLARILTRRAVGLVFAGGGSRGFAHIGVLRALDELGIPIDLAGGASVGAMIAGACGLEIGWRQVERDLPRLMQRAFYQPTLPVVSFMTGQAVLAGARELAGGDFDLEDFARPTFYVATNLARGAPEVLRRGSSALGIRASSSIPGIFPPVARGRELLVDGGISNNLPIDVMAEEAGAIVAVDIIPDLALEADRPTQLAASGLRELAGRVRGSASLPSILSVMMCTATSSAQGLRSGARSARSTDLILRPTLTRWNMVNFSSPGPIVQQGYAQSRAALEAWWRERRGHILGEMS